MKLVCIRDTPWSNPFNYGPRYGEEVHVSELMTDNKSVKYKLQEYPDIHLNDNTYRFHFYQRHFAEPCENMDELISETLDQVGVTVL